VSDIYVYSTGVLCSSLQGAMTAAMADMRSAVFDTERAAGLLQAAYVSQTDVYHYCLDCL